MCTVLLPPGDNSIAMLIKGSNLMQQCADIYLLQSHCTCFGASQHPLSGALKTVTATSGIGHNTGTATSFQRGLMILLTLIHDARNHELKKKQLQLTNISYHILCICNSRHVML